MKRLLLLIFLPSLVLADAQIQEGFETLGVRPMLENYQKVILIKKPMIKKSINPCGDFYSYVCSERASGEKVLPLVSVSQLEQQFAARIAEVFRVIERQRSSNTFAENYLSHFQLLKKLDRWQEMKNEVILQARELLRTQSLKENEIQNVVQELGKISFNRDYLSKPNRLVRLGVSVGESIHVGGEVLLRMNSDSAIFFVIAHELGHAVRSKFYQLFGDTKSCIQTKYTDLKIFGFDNSERRELIDMGFSPEDVADASAVDRGIPLSAEEIWADHFAHKLLVKFIRSKNTDTKSKLEMLRDSLRFFCAYEGTRQGHPSGRFRIERLAENKDVQEWICPQEPKSEMNYCF